MIPPFEKLHKFLRLEISRKFDNRAVFGGLHLYAKNWISEAQSFNADPETINTVYSLLSSYGDKGIEERKAIVNEIIELIGYTQTANSGNTTETNNAENKVPEKEPSPENSIPSQTVVRKPVVTANQQLPIKPKSGDPSMGIYAPITVINQIGPKNAALYNKLGVRTILDLLYYFPRRYVDFSKLEPINRLNYGDTVTVMATVMNTATRPIKGGRFQLTETIVSDGTGSLRLTWFNQPWIEPKLKPGTQISASGKLDMYLGRLIMNNPEWEPLDQEHLHTNRIVPVYPLTAGVSSKMLRRIMNTTVSFWSSRLQEFIPDIILRSAGLVSIQEAIQNVHFPDTPESLIRAKQRLGFDEIFLLQLGVIRQKLNWQAADGKVFPSDESFIQSIMDTLPYQLTNAQLKVLEEIRHDFTSGKALNRLIQGDVGSGKTVVAAIAAAIIANGGSQSAYMAPTSILAEQQYRTLQNLLTSGNPPFLQPEEINLLIGDTPQAEKNDIRHGLEEGKVKIIVGTHALLEGPVVFKDLQLVVIDEQHRFGVEQRATLRSKGTNPHLLVMTATPIPRSLALTLYGDLDVSILDEMPAGRQPVATFVIHPLNRERAYQLISAQIEQGFQAFMIFPLVEQGEQEDVKAAVEEHARLQKEIFPQYQLGLLHGRMKPEEKDNVMQDFKNKKFDILVSTSVVEVGVDVPNATIMLIEGANRFGLAQLHQFRGRVGRGSQKSTCILIPDNEDALENERLAVMTQTNDGFVLAEKDLSMRGPGDFLGTRQAGFLELRMASITDVRLIEEARKHATQIFESDPELSAPEHQPLHKMVNRFWRSGEGDIS